MQLGIIGLGAIGSYVAEALGAAGLPVRAAIVRRPADTHLPQVHNVAGLPEGITHLVDCAGHSGLAAHGPDALAAGIDVVSLSLGALADATLERRLAAAADHGGGRLILASGAIGGLDALRAARIGGLERVRYVGRKPPLGWAGSPAEDSLDLATLSVAKTHFEGSAREAALRYPKNANVAAAVALSGLGLDETHVSLIADPAAAGNTHRIEAEGAFGSLTFEITGNALPGNPRSSALAAMSAVAEIQRLAATITT